MNHILKPTDCIDVDSNSLSQTLVELETLNEPRKTVQTSELIEFSQWWTGNHQNTLHYIGGAYQAHHPITMKFVVPASVYLHVRISGESSCWLEGSPKHATATPEVQIWSVPSPNVKIVQQPPNRSTRFLMYFLPPDMLQNLNGLGRSAQDESDGPTLYTLPVTPAVRIALEAAFQANVTESHRHLYRSAKTTEALALLLDQLNHAPASVWKNCSLLRASDYEKIRVAEMMLRNRPDTHWTMKDLSREVSLNVNKLQAGFQKMFGVTVFNYLSEVRLETGLMHLRSTDLSIAQISYRSGFSSPSHFTHLFRKRYGETPSTYRRRIENEDYAYKSF